MNTGVLLNALVHAGISRVQQYDKWCYERGILIKSLLDAYDASGESAPLDFAVEVTNKYILSNGEIPSYPANTYNLDMICYGSVLKRLFERTVDSRYPAVAERLLVQIDRQPMTAEGGFWHKMIYPNQMWLDGIYMACPFMTDAADWLDKPELYDTVARQMLLIYRKTVVSETGLCRHAWCADALQPWADRITGRSPHVWGRAMGWFMMAHVDVLERYPLFHPRYAELLQQFQQLSEAVILAQHDGLWYQVMDCPGKDGNYSESSCSAMFIYSLVKGSRLGFLPVSALDKAANAFAVLSERNMSAGADGMPQLDMICKVAGLGGTPYRDGSYEYYIHEEVCSNDYKGFAPLIMACAELLRTEEGKT